MVLINWNYLALYLIVDFFYYTPEMAPNGSRLDSRFPYSDVVVVDLNDLFIVEVFIEEEEV